ncbi:hypothetical protein [Corynebacterium sp. sy039]|uniref:hypothetical protein n=1 Tax=Corynebacterium sp. sy039 TaxID=2599641 RepID=UPI0011B85CC7|nr:hypothetical protein [Corynebacterium sp. sy039]QDZ42436.1 hypothetical protein FQV43_04120 [Corynebacterium sp. sy039]
MFNSLFFKKNRVAFYGLLSFVIFFIPTLFIGFSGTSSDLGQKQWSEFSEGAAAYTWNYAGQVFHSLIAPILCAAIASLAMKPEFVRKNFRWVAALPKGMSFIMREKAFFFLLAALFSSLSAFLIFFVGMLVHGVESKFLWLYLLYALVGSLGFFTTFTLYGYIAVKTKSVGVTIGIAFGLTVLTLAFSVLTKTHIELYFPTSQIVSLEMVRSPGESSWSVFLTKAIISSLWSCTFLWLLRCAVKKDF